MALTRDLPDSFAEAIVEHYQPEDKDAASSPVSISVARQQHEQYGQALRDLGVCTVSLPAQPTLPDSLFVEDTAVVVQHNFGGDQKETRAVLMNPGHKDRQPEVDDVAAVLEKLLALGGCKLERMQALDEKAFGDGGDVLYTGRHLFVGVAEQMDDHLARTNVRAVAVLEKVLDPLPVLPVVLNTESRRIPVLHLKSAITHMDAHTLVAPAAPWTHRLLRQMRVHELGYQVLRIPDVLACNVVVLPDHKGLLLQDTPCAESRAVLQQAADERGLPYRWVDTSEL